MPAKKKEKIMAIPAFPESYYSPTNKAIRNAEKAKSELKKIYKRIDLINHFEAHEATSRAIEAIDRMLVKLRNIPIGTGLEKDND